MWSWSWGHGPGSPCTIHAGNNFREKNQESSELVLVIGLVIRLVKGLVIRLVIGLVIGVGDSASQSVQLTAAVSVRFRFRIY